MQLTSGCKFEFRGPNCNSSGTLSSQIEEQGEVTLKTTTIAEESNCPFQGEKSCKYVLLFSEILWNCGDEGHESLLKEKDSYDIESLSKDASEGDVKAKKELAFYYLKNKKVKKAEDLLRKMATDGDEEAISALGLVYFYGSLGFKKSYKQSLKWNLLAAKNGSAEAKYIIGSHYYKGLGIKKKYSTAREWFQKAGLQNNVLAQKELARMWTQGVEGVVKTYDAKYWLERAVELGDSQAVKMLAELNNSQPLRVGAQVNEWRPEKTEELEKPKEEVTVIPPLLVEEKKVVLTPVVAEEKKTETVSQPIAVISEKIEKEPGYRYFNSIFVVKPYFLFQERQGAVPSVALGITPGLQIGNVALKIQASISLLNMALGDTFAAHEIQAIAGFKVETLFYELGYGFEFWPAPGGTASTVSVSAGKILSKDFLGFLPLKTVSLGYTQTFFDDHTYKFFIGTSF